MKKLRRYWNQNRGKIIIIIAIVAFIIILIQVVNQILKDNESKKTSVRNIDRTKPTQSVITGEVVSEEKTERNTNIIKEFVDYCNNKQYESAYNLLTEECKKEFDNNVNTFINNYYKNVFKTNRTYNIDLWLNEGNMYTYKIKYFENNLLATGSMDTNKNVEDYITIIEQNGESKININGFITEKMIDKSQTVNNIEFIINSKKVYKNYETYHITIRNRSNKTIIIGDGQDSESICLLDRNKIKYPSFINEIPIDSLSLKSGYEKNIRIRFNKLYDLYRTIDKMQFSSIILDAEEYMKNPNDTSLEKTGIEIDI